MTKYEKILYAIGISLLIAGLRTLLMWSDYSSNLMGLIILCFAFLIIYIAFKKDMKTSKLRGEINNIKNILLGFILVIVDLIYNIITNDSFNNFDYGMIIAGLIIILLNMNLLQIINIESRTKEFITLFLFFTMSLSATASTGITYIYTTITGYSINPLYHFVTDLTIKSSFFFLKLIKNTSLTENVINFDGMKVSIAYPCSGVESMILFLSVIAAYFISTREKNIIKILSYAIFGIIMFYSTNVLRVVIIFLVGYHFGIDALKFTHYNLGWILFTAGMVVYWSILLNDNNGNKQ